MTINRKIYNLLAPVITFFLGIVFQSLLNDWLSIKNFLDLALIAIIVVLTFIFTASLTTFHSMETKFETVEGKFEHVEGKLENLATEIANRSGIHIESVEDNFDGKSYQRSTELIEKAKLSITFVSPWEPNMEYVPGVYPDEVRIAKQNYYMAIQKQIENFMEKDFLFHRRILQISPEFIDKPLMFRTDSSFYDYLYFASVVQLSHPRTCRIRMVPTMMGSHFTIIDERYVIVSTTSLLKSGHNVRHSTIIVDDTQGDLVKYFNFIYQTLDAHSSPIKPQDFEVTYTE